MESKELHAIQALEARQRQADELEFTFFPQFAPPGWSAPVDYYSDGSHSNVEHEDAEGMELPEATLSPQQRKRGRKRKASNSHPPLQSILSQAQSGGNPTLDQLFGSTISQRLRQKQSLLDLNQPNPKKSSKSASGAMQSNGVLRHQVNGVPITPITTNAGPSMKALEDVKRRTGGLVTAAKLGQADVLPVRVQVIPLVFYFF